MKRQTADGRRGKPFGSEGVELPTGGSVQHPRNQWFTHHASRFTYCLLLTVYCLLFLSGCEVSFEPYQENEAYYFSIYGYLDASADTQWIRVAPARQEFNAPPEVPEGLRVTLEHLESGNQVVMNDSLVEEGSGFNFINFWTTMDIEHGQQYRLKAERSDGASSQATVTLPEMFPTPQLKENARSSFTEPLTFTLLVNGVYKLADVQTWWYVGIFGPNLDERRLYDFSYRNEAVQISDGSYTVLIEPEKEREQIEEETLLPPGSQLVLLYRQIYVASAGPDWIEGIASLDDPSYSVPNSFSNVKNGLGYVIGIDSKVVPYVSCFDSGGLTPCEEEEPYW